MREAKLGRNHSEQAKLIIWAASVTAQSVLVTNYITGETK